MGIDIVFASLILLWAVRGWFKGFLVQTIALVALVGSVYLAAPVRDLARPYAAKHLASVDAGILDVMLWWLAVAVCYFVPAAIATSILKSTRKKQFGVVEPNHGDQGLGFLLGGLKGFVLVAFVAMGITDHASKFLQADSVLAEQVKASRSLGWSRQYQFANRIWNAVPVQHFVQQIQSHGFWNGPGGGGATAPPSAATARAGGTPARTLRIPNPGDVKQELESIEAQLRQLKVEADEQPR